MDDRKAILAAMQKAAADIEAENDNFLRAIAMVAANGRAHIIPADDLLFGQGRTVICLPKKQYDRLAMIIREDGGHG